MNTYTHTCPCGAKYQSEDEDPYVCEACAEKRRAIAAEIDSKPRPPREEHLSGIQLYDSLPKIRGFVNANDIL